MRCLFTFSRLHSRTVVQSASTSATKQNFNRPRTRLWITKTKAASYHYRVRYWGKTTVLVNLQKYLDKTHAKAPGHPTGTGLLGLVPRYATYGDIAFDRCRYGLAERFGLEALFFLEFFSLIYQKETNFRCLVHSCGYDISKYLSSE